MNLESLKNLDGKKKRDFIVSLIIMLIVLLISFNYIFKQDNLENSNLDNEINDKSGINNDTEKKLATILSEIEGISDVSVMITYKSDTKLNPVYNVNEEFKGNDKLIKREVVYNEEGSDKKVVVESVEIPSVEGVVVVGKGINNSNLKSKVLNAISSLTGASLHRIEVFEKGE